MSSVNFDIFNTDKIKKYNKKKFSNLSPIEIINKLIKKGSKIENGSDSKLLTEIMDDIIFDDEEIIKNKQIKERKYNMIKLLEKYKRLKIYKLNLNNDKIKLLIIIDDKTGVFSIYLGDINSTRYCGYITFTTSPYKVENNIEKDNFINIKYHYGYIEWIKPKENCRLSLTGTQILKLFINLGYLFNIDRIDLKDKSNINCEYKNKIKQNSLKYYKIITEGSTWYEKYNFLPSPEKKERKFSDKQILYPNIPISYNDQNLNNKLVYKNFYKDYKTHIKIFNSFNINYLTKINFIINNNIVLKKNIINDINDLNDSNLFLQQLDLVSTKISKYNKNNKSLNLKNYIKKINEVNCINFYEFEEIFINNDDFMDNLLFIVGEYEKWFNIKIINEINLFYDALKFLEKINYYYLIL
jgi:hypothetical protein